MQSCQRRRRRAVTQPQSDPETGRAAPWGWSAVGGRWGAGGVGSRGDERRTRRTARAPARVASSPPRPARRSPRRTPRRRARPRHRPAAAGAASAVRPAAGGERAAGRARHGGPRDAGGETLAVGALVSGRPGWGAWGGKGRGHGRKVSSGAEASRTVLRRGAGCLLTSIPRPRVPARALCGSPGS